MIPAHMLDGTSNHFGVLVGAGVPLAGCRIQKVA
jgi:hypothetical protein